jgi:broad specificity phosphatase PhoE
VQVTATLGRRYSNGMIYLIRHGQTEFNHVQRCQAAGDARAALPSEARAR